MYRSAVPALEQRIEALKGELGALDAEERELGATLEAQERATAEHLASLAAHGPGGGARGASILCIPLVVGGLLVVAVLVVPLAIYIGGYVRKQPGETIVPILLLAVPALVAAVIAWPYRRVRASYRRASITGVALVVITLAIVALGLAGALK
jgi:hypothetical protein